MCFLNTIENAVVYPASLTTIVYKHRISDRASGGNAHAYLFL